MQQKKTTTYIIPSGRQEDKITTMLELVGFHNASNSLKLTHEKIRIEDGTYLDFLDNFLEKELLYREDSRITYQMQKAKFPFKRRIADFDFSFQPSIKVAKINELISCRYIEEGRNVFFLGPPGVGKTHLATGLGIEAIEKGYNCRFFTINSLIELIERLESEKRAELFRELVRCDLLVIDDVDNTEINNNVSFFLFKLVFERNEKASIIFTSNKQPKEWGGLFGSKATQGVDRILGGRAEVINIVGDSYRLRDQIQKLKPIFASDYKAEARREQAQSPSVRI